MLHRKQRVVNAGVMPAAHRLLEVVEESQWHSLAKVGRRGDADRSQIIRNVASYVGKVFESGNLFWSVRFHGTVALTPDKWLEHSFAGFCMNAIVDISHIANKTSVGCKRPAILCLFFPEVLNHGFHGWARIKFGPPCGSCDPWF